MYDEMVKQLRAASAAEAFMFRLLPEGKGNVTADLFKEAADAIEELYKAKETLAEQVAHWQAELTKSKCGEYLAELNAPRWIPVEERLPPEMEDKSPRSGWNESIRPSDDVQVYLASEKRQTVAWYSHAYNEWSTVDESTVYVCEVTHWMPLQEPPEREVGA